MSYELIYDKQFIKVKENQFVPMILCGSSNCYEWSPNGGERRARSWWAYNIKGKVVLSLEEMEAYADSVRQSIMERNEHKKGDEWYEEYSDANFGYWSAIAINGTTRSTTFGNFKGLFTTGAKKSLTIEELMSENVNVSVKNGYYDSVMKEKYGVEPYFKGVKSGQELLDAIAECNERFKDTPVQATVEFGYMSDDKPKQLRQKYFKPVKKEKTAIQVDKYYTILIEGKYLKKWAKNLYYYSPYPVLQLTEKEAQKRVKRYNKKYPHLKHEVEVVNSPTTLYV